MATQTIRGEESLGLLWAVALHCALGLALVLFRPSLVVPPPDGTMTVTLSDEFAMEATSPNPTPEFKPDTAPELGDVPPPPEPEPAARPIPRPAVAARPVPRPSTRPTTRPSQQASPRPSATPRQTQSGTPGGRRVDGTFLEGVDGPARPSAQQMSSFQSSINSRVLPHWNRCSVTGLEVERLRAVVTFTLTREGAVQSIDNPQITGVTESNRPQVEPFRACAVRAIRLGAPYRLPAEYYDYWRDRRLNFSLRNRQ